MEGIRSYLTFHHLGGVTVSPDQVVSEIARWPLDGILGFLRARSVEAVHAGPDFADPRRQGHYLNLAIVDDFPAPLPSAAKMYVPGRTPITGGDNIFIHDQNLAWLAHTALLHAREGGVTPELDYELQRRLCRLLLITNDFFVEGAHTSFPSNLIEARAFVLSWLRHGQFNTFFEQSSVTMFKLVRQRILMLDILPRYFPAVESAFLEATGGVSLRRYFEILTLFVTFIHHDMSPDRRWLIKDMLCAAVRAGRDEIERILKRWIRTPDEYRCAWTAWCHSRPAPGLVPFYDFVPLRETPLIEARPGELICPVISFLFAKIADEPYFILSDHLSNPGKFQQALGEAYQECAHTLVERIRNADTGANWQVRSGPRVRKGGELSDSYLQKGDVAIAFEHKGGRPGTDFLRGGDGDRVLGPRDVILTRLETQESVTLREGYDNDNGFLTRGMWQQSSTGAALPRWAERQMGFKPQRVFPIISHLSELRVDPVVRVGYLNPLMARAKLYQEPFWYRPQWLHVSDLEALASLAEQGRLDLATLLHEKNTRFENKRFDIFLYERFGGIPIDRQLYDAGLALLQEVGASFWLEDLQEEHEENSSP